MGKGREVFTFEQKCNLSKKTKSTNFGSHTSSDRENSEIAFDSNSDILKYDNHRKNNNNKVYSYSKRFITILNYIFCILGIICAWGAIDSLVQVISGKQVYISLACYSVILFVAIVTLTLYILFIDRNYRPCDFF
ncbi:conserved Plasmodium protein, unknown function [Plasmodium ovale]|uniref:Uncharacterized protein n=1 Tax=Plasmodium ovale TaxID=36330 RepID=A0A1D3UB00_PLAOA|nr:conserved Plasmodium protein, unknown function [Plasmodium ovale]